MNGSNKRIEDIQGEINAMKQLLNNTDYKALKYAEGEISAEDYAETKAKRQHWRDRINELEEELEQLSAAPSES